ncbi:MAG: TPM domain-containing protein [Pseudoxanthomonas sp.]
MLKPEEAQLIEQAIQAVERKTSCEIVVCMRDSSGEDRGTAAMAAVLALLLVLAVASAFWPDIDLLVPVGVGLALAIGAYFIWDYLDLGLKLLPARLVAEDARRAARTVFLDRGLDTTPQRNAVLLFISRAERYVEILPDRGLAAAVPAQRWANIVTSFQEMARRKGMAEAAADAIDRIGAVCAGPFPAGADNPDLIPNKPLTD